MKKKLLFSLICLLVIFSIGQVSFAAIEIVPSKNGKGTDQIVNTTISNSYMQCRQMKEYGGSLYGTTVEPHLATNKDWGAVSYLANSIYGTNKAGKNTGVTVTIDGVKYYSTTPNITGVMNWGNNPNDSYIYTQTAGLVSAATSTDEKITELYNNRNTDFVEFITPTNASSTKGMAVSETSTFQGQFTARLGNSSAYPISIRSGFFVVDWGVAGNNGKAHGNSDSDVTFRPVIWN